MRVLVDLVDSFTGIVRFIIGAFVLVGFGTAILLTAGVSYVAPKVADGASERVAQLGEKAIEEARDARRERELAKDGWGYSSQDSDPSRFQSSNRGNDWGEND